MAGASALISLVGRVMPDMAGEAHPTKSRQAQVGAEVGMCNVSIAAVISHLAQVLSRLVDLASSSIKAAPTGVAVRSGPSTQDMHVGQALHSHSTKSPKYGDISRWLSPTYKFPLFRHDGVERNSAKPVATMIPC